MAPNGKSGDHSEGTPEGGNREFILWLSEDLIKKQKGLPRGGCYKNSKITCVIQNIMLPLRLQIPLSTKQTNVCNSVFNGQISPL